MILFIFPDMRNTKNAISSGRKLVISRKQETEAKQQEFWGHLH